MDEFIKKLLDRLEELHGNYKKQYRLGIGNLQVLDGCQRGLEDAIEIVNELAEEYNNGFCEWNYSCLDEDLIRPFHHKGAVGMYKECLKNNPFCSCCGKKIKVVE